MVLLPGGTKPSPKPILIYDQRGPMVIADSKIL